MPGEVGRRNKINEDENYELRELRQVAKIASIYHGRSDKFRRNPNISHIVHAKMHLSQFFVTLIIQIFHHVHHHVVKNLRKQNPSIPVLPDEMNPLFLIYPICSVISLIFTVLWLWKKILLYKPLIVLMVSFVLALAMLLVGILEMKEVDDHIDISQVSDAELLTHPVFIHNFIMCIFSILCMTTFLIHSWILYDYWRWIRKEKDGDESSDYKVSVNSEDSEAFTPRSELQPIPTLGKLTSITFSSSNLPIDEEPVILYCCFVDFYNYIKYKYSNKEPVHEFQVVHVV